MHAERMRSACVQVKRVVWYLHISFEGGGRGGGEGGMGMVVEYLRWQWAVGGSGLGS